GLSKSSTQVPTSADEEKSEINVGPCTWVINRKCPDDRIGFYLFTRHNTKDRQYIHIDSNLKLSNISVSYFDPKYPVKIIIHGYNSDMFLQPLIDMKDEFLQRSNYNLIYVDWSDLAPSPCYLSAVHNIKHTGACIAQLVERVLDLGTDDIHVIGFSLGAQVTNYIALNLKSFQLPRITGLDPALPLFTFVPKDEKLDASDADFVDVIHTNALLQGKIERCGHADFYMNGGVLQPGCFGAGSNPFACSHHRAPDYYAESIRSFRGFWGWPCRSYINYLLGLCPKSDRIVVAGEDCRSETRGMFLVTTNSVSPFAIGRWTDNVGVGDKISKVSFADPLQRQIDPFGKIEGHFNNLDIFPTPYSQDPNGSDWPYFDQPSEDSLRLEEIKLRILSASTEQNDSNVISMQKLKTSLSAEETLIARYKNNLTKGFIDDKVFKVPEVILNN
ncbi:Pancreatic lipase-related protein 3, partial [Pseudolycoriella hygida]